MLVQRFGLSELCSNKAMNIWIYLYMKSFLSGVIAAPQSRLAVRGKTGENANSILNNEY